jgi:hypothetical protein
MTNKDSEGDAKQQFVAIDEIQNRLPGNPSRTPPIGPIITGGQSHAAACRRSANLVLSSVAGTIHKHIAKGLAVASTGWGMVRLLRLLLRPVESFLAQCISISTEPSAFVRERVHLGDTTNFLRGRFERG